MAQSEPGPLTVGTPQGVVGGGAGVVRQGGSLLPHPVKVVDAALRVLPGAGVSALKVAVAKRQARPVVAETDVVEGDVALE